MFHSVAGMGAALVAVIVAAVGIHGYKNGAILIGAVLVMMFFMFYNEGKEDEKGQNFNRLAFWAIVIIGDILAIARLIQNYT